MTVQTSFSAWEYAGKKKGTWRDRFLAEIDAITPRLALEQTVTPFYPKRADRAWPPLGLSRMLRLVHTVIGTAGNASNISQAEALLHGQETMVFADAGYQGVEKPPESQGSEVEWQVAMKPSKRKQLAGTELDRLVEQVGYAKARIRAKVEHPFHVVKNLFKHKKMRYKGLAKNTAQLFSLFDFANLVLARRWLLGADSQVAS